MNDSQSLILEDSSTESSPSHHDAATPRKSNNNVRIEYEELLEQSALLIEDGISCRDINHKMKSLFQIQAYRLVIFSHLPLLLKNNYQLVASVCFTLFKYY